MCEVGVQLHCFACGGPVVPEPFLEETNLAPTEWSWHRFQKSIGRRHVDLFLNSQFYPIDFCLSLCQCHTVLITVALQ